MSFRVPMADIRFALGGSGGLEAALAGGLFPGLTTDIVDAILAEGARFAEAELAPLNPVADRQGARFSNGKVITPPGFKEAYRRFAEAGWSGIAGPRAYGGQELPVLVEIALEEMNNAACPAFSVGLMLTADAVGLISTHAGEDLKALYLPKLLSGQWSASMCMTEPHAGSDIGAIRTKAEPAPGGAYRLFGQKIFITYGEHDLTENIVHLVLARVSGAPAGTRGLSLFLVPKYLPSQTGGIGEHNDVACAGIEEKLGLHGSPTCTMIFGEKGVGALGFLLGEKHRGLNAMFLMMNRARLTVGIQGVAIAERAFQAAHAYALTRRQGRAATPPAEASEGMSLIVEHPDIQRGLLTIRAMTAIARALCYACAGAIDRSRHGPKNLRSQEADLASLLTPVAKAFSTDIGVDSASLALQLHGGAGYIEETGIAQLYRDARIFPIYEGTNGIQAIDLVTRRLTLDGGRTARKFFAQLRRNAASVQVCRVSELSGTAERLDRALDDLEAASLHLTELQSQGKIAAALAGATPFLRLFGLATGGALLAGAVAGEDFTLGQSLERAALCRFFAESLLGESSWLRERVIEGADSLAGAGKFLAG